MKSVHRGQLAFGLMAIEKHLAMFDINSFFFSSLLLIESICRIHCFFFVEMSNTFKRNFHFTIGVVHQNSRAQATQSITVHRIR